jgi:hypothetical protein
MAVEISYSMEQSPSCEANSFSASPEIPHILWNLKVHCHVYNSPLSVPISARPIQSVSPIPLPEDQF